MWKYDRNSMRHRSYIFHMYLIFIFYLTGVLQSSQEYFTTTTAVSIIVGEN